MHPHQLYCINILSFTHTSAKNNSRIVRLQKKAIRIITKSKINEHTGPLFLEYRIQQIEKLMLQSKFHFMHAIHYENAPKSVQNTFIKNVNSEIIYELRNADAYIFPAAL